MDNNNKQMKTLLEQLRPEIAEALEKNRDKYDFSITDLYNKLDKKYLYADLSVRDMRDLTLYTDVICHNWDSMDWRFGTKLFKN
jgi:hypothetical protein